MGKHLGLFDCAIVLDLLPERSVGTFLVPFDPGIHQNPKRLQGIAERGGTRILLDTNSPAPSVVRKKTFTAKDIETIPCTMRVCPALRDDYLMLNVLH